MSCAIPAGSTCAEERAEGDGGEGLNGVATKMLKIKFISPQQLESFFKKIHVPCEHIWPHLYKTHNTLKSLQF